MIWLYIAAAILVSLPATAAPLTADDGITGLTADDGSTQLLNDSPKHPRLFPLQRFVAKQASNHAMPVGCIEFGEMPMLLCDNNEVYSYTPAGWQVARPVDCK